MSQVLPIRPSYLKDLAGNVRRRRKARKLTVKTLAELAGMSASTIERIERADPNEPSVGKVLALKGALESRSVDELLSAQPPATEALQVAEDGAGERLQGYFDFLIELARAREVSGKDSSEILDRIERLIDLDTPTGKGP